MGRRRERTGEADMKRVAVHLLEATVKRVDAWRERQRKKLGSRAPVTITRQDAVQTLIDEALSAERER